MHMEFPGQGSDPIHSCNILAAYSNHATRPFTYCAGPEIRICVPAFQRQSHCATAKTPKNAILISFPALFLLIVKHAVTVSTSVCIIFSLTHSHQPTILLTPLKTALINIISIPTGQIQRLFLCSYLKQPLYIRLHNQLLLSYRNTYF